MILSLGKVLATDVRRRLRVTAIDVNRTACDMVFINTTLWAIPTRVIHGNSLSMEFWAAWSNVFYVASWPVPRVKSPILESPQHDVPPPPPELERIKARLVQGDLKF